MIHLVSRCNALQQKFHHRGLPIIIRLTQQQQHSSSYQRQPQKNDHLISKNTTQNSLILSRYIGTCDEGRPKTIDIGKEIPLPGASEIKTKGVDVLKLPSIYAALSKWYLTWFVVMTADAGFCLAPEMFEHHSFFFLTMGTALCSSAANTLNQIAEIKYDALMERTAARPLVRKTITPQHALAFAAISGASGVAMLGYGCNTLTAMLGLFNIGLYAGVYTPMKRQHWFNTWIGSIVGAIPPVMGWTAATGHISPGAFVLSGILYAWQFPHFYALAWRRKADYARGNYHMLPISHPNATKMVALTHSLGLLGLCVMAPFTGVTTWSFIATSTPLNLWIIYESMRFYQQGTNKSAHKLYKCSLYYIVAISLAIIADRKMVRPYLEKKNKASTTEQLVEVTPSAAVTPALS